MDELFGRGSVRAAPGGRPRPGGPVVGRRACLTGGAGLIAWLQPWPLAVGAAAPREVDIRYVLTDRRIGASLVFARALRADRAERGDVAAGLTSIWRNDLLRLWRSGAGGVAGLTTRGVWECVAEQARSHQRRTILAGFHAVDPRSGAASHRIVSSPRVIDAAKAQGMGGAAWPLAMAAFAKRCSAAERDCATEWRTGPPAPVAGPHDSLVSWVIA